MSAKRFCKIWFLSLGLAGLLIYPAILFATLNLGDKLPGLGSVKKAYAVKNKIAAGFSGESVLYVAGGSSAYYGIDAALVGKRLDRPVINYGVHAGLGLEYQLLQLEKVLKPGDSVVLAFELFLLGKSLNTRTDFLHAYLTTYDKPYLLRGGLIRLWKDLYNTPWSDLTASAVRWMKIVAGKTEYGGKMQMTQLLMDDRGDILFEPETVRPLREQGFTRMGQYALAMMERFLSHCRQMDVQVYFTWETAARHSGYFGENDEKYRQRYLSFFRENGVVVLDECLDHLYPEAFYSNTFNHLNFAGRRIRSEKLAAALQRIFQPEREAQEEKPLFLIDPSHHETRWFDRLAGVGLNYRAYLPDAPEGEDTVNEATIEGLLNSGTDLYFNDSGLRGLRVFERATVETVEVNYRVFGDIFQRYPNHLFFIVQNGPVLAWQQTPGTGTEAVAEFFFKEGYKAALIGTGRYSDVKKKMVQNRPIQLFFKEGDPIGSLQLPFDIQLISSLNASTGEAIGAISMGGVFFRPTSNRPGLWCVVYDPELEIVSDRFLYEKPDGNIEAELFCVRKGL